MADRGRKRLPKGMKVLTGSGRPDPESRGKRERGELPPAPAWLDPLAAEFWRAAAEILAERGIGTRGDGWSLEGMARLYSRWRQAEEVVEREGATFICAKTDNPKRRPEAVESLQCWKELRMMFNECGLTPAAFAKFADRDQAKDDNPFAEFA